MKTLEYFGCVSGGYDNTNELIKALSSGEKSLYASGHYYFGGQVPMPYSVKIFGDGIGRSGFVATEPAQDMFLVTTQAPVQFMDMDISATALKTAGAAISFDSGPGTQNDFSDILRVRFLNQMQAVDYGRSAYWHNEGCIYQNNAPGGTLIRVRNETTPDSGDQTLKDGKFFGGEGVTFVRYESGGGLIASGNKFLQGATAFDLSCVPGAVTGILILTGNSYDGQTSTALSLTNLDATSSFTNVVIGHSIFDGNPANAFIYANQVAGVGGVGRCAIVGSVLIRDKGTYPLILLGGGGNYHVGANSVNGAGGYAGIYIGGDVTDSWIGPGQCNGVVVENHSATTTVI